MDWKLEVVVLPVADVDRAKAFYLEQAGFELQVDFSAGDSFRVVHFIPPGSACALALMQNEEAAGSVRGLHLVVNDIEAARAELVARGAPPSDLYHFVDGAQQPGPRPDREDYGTYFSFNDPDGNEFWYRRSVPAEPRATEGRRRGLRYAPSRAPRFARGQPCCRRSSPPSPGTGSGGPRHRACRRSSPGSSSPARGSRRLQPPARIRCRGHWRPRPCCRRTGR